MTGAVKLGAHHLLLAITWLCKAIGLGSVRQKKKSDAEGRPLGKGGLIMALTGLSFYMISKEDLAHWSVGKQLHLFIDLL